MKKSILAIQIIVAVVFVSLLSFIDEGNYDFRWVSNYGDWISFFLYVAIIFAVQFFIYNLILKQDHASK